MRKIALIFPGQGSHFTGMGKTLYDKYDYVKEIFHEADDVLGYSLSKICFDGSLGELSRVENMFPAILATSYSYYRVYLDEIGIKPKVSAGHSLGEISALTCSGAINFTDAIKIVKKRSELANLLYTKQIGTMSIIDGVDRHIVESVCKKISDRVNIACYNAKDQVTISGDISDVMIAEDKLNSLGGIITPMMMSAPFHSSSMDSIIQDWRYELEKYTYSNFDFPVISNVTSKPYKDKNYIVENLVSQLVKPVLWQDTIEYLSNIDINIIVEIGPQSILSNLLRDSYGIPYAFAFSHIDDNRELLKAIYKDGVKTTPNVVDRCIYYAVTTPCKNSNNTDYKKNVLEPYAELIEMKNKLNSNKSSDDQIKEAIFLLKKIFKEKEVSINEQNESVNEILTVTGNDHLLDKINYSLEIACH